MRAGAIIVAGGSGSRMGRPKQFLSLCGRPVVEWSVDVFRGMPEFAEIIVVLSGEDVLEHGPVLASGNVHVVEAGSTRMGSVINGFKALDSGVDVVAVHDGARPLVTEDVVRRTLEEAAKSGAAVAAVPAKDTLKQVAAKGLWVKATPVRADIWQAQTPQSYKRSVLAEALEQFGQEKDATDESQLVERAGRKVKVVESSYCNMKVTTPEDLLIAAALLSARRSGEGLVGRIPRAGFGYDLHRLVKGRPLILAGMKVPHPKGLLGHSDGDVVLHAASDAVLGAVGEGEIGIAFPPTDDRFKGIDSRRIVEHVLEKVSAHKGEILNLDVTIVAEEPKLKPLYDELADSLAGCFRLDRSKVNLKSKSNEGLGELGRGEAIACYAAASVAVPLTPVSGA